MATTRLRPALGPAEATAAPGLLARAWVVLPVTPDPFRPGFDPATLA